jgi:uncharacterized protein YceK
MKKLLLTLTVISLLGTGCANVSSVVRAMAKDPATVHVRVTSVYGTVEVFRTAPMTNSMPHTINPDGTITVGK